MPRLCFVEVGREKDDAASRAERVEGDLTYKVKVSLGVVEKFLLPKESQDDLIGST